MAVLKLRSPLNTFERLIYYAFIAAVQVLILPFQTLYNFRIYVLQQRDIKKEIQPSKLMEDNNFIDNLSECESIIDRFFNQVNRLEEGYIKVENSPQLNMVSNYGGNGLDGYQFDLTLSDKLYGYC